MEVKQKPLRSQPTRDRILAAAREIFAREGYEGTTIRGIAEAASINPSMVMRYYGSKDALFAQVAQLDFQAGYLVGVPRAELGEALVRHVLGRWEDPEGGPAMAAMCRAAFTHGPAQERVAELFGRQVAKLFVDLGITARSPHTGALIATQMIGLGICRYVLKLPGAVGLPPDLIVDRVGRVVQGYIDAADAASLS
jgi:AcrR family transcriptional regulator